MASDQIAVRVRISGRVQGVSYRAWVRDEALQYDVSGWVRNAADGSVHALFVGSEDEIERFLERLGEGPPAADVRAVETEPADLPDPVPESFTIKH